MKQKKQINDFLTDKSFANWAKGVNQKDCQAWDSWLQNHPEEAGLAAEAKLLLTGISFRKKDVPRKAIDRSWERLSDELERDEKDNVRQLSPRRQWLGIAASLVFLLVAGWWFFHNNNAPTLLKHRTGFGETKTIELPDGSSLVLNAGSKIAFHEDWSNENNRLVELDGEAYFEISKQPNGKTLEIKTADLTVEVVGTSFNINSKREHSIVSLVEGELRLKCPHFEEKTLTAGQTAFFNKNKKAFEITNGKTGYWSNWVFQKWSFGKSIPMVEVLERINETYGLEYEVSDPAILQKTASGEVSIESQKVLLEALSVLLELDMVVKENKLYVSASIAEKD